MPTLKCQKANNSGFHPAPNLRFYMRSGKPVNGACGHSLKRILRALVRAEGMGFEDRKDLLGYLLKI